MEKSNEKKKIILKIIKSLFWSLEWAEFLYKKFEKKDIKKQDLDILEAILIKTINNSQDKIKNKKIKASIKNLNKIKKNESIEREKETLEIEKNLEKFL